MPFIKGKSGNPNGRKHGSINKDKRNIYLELLTDVLNMYRNGNYYVYYHINSETNEIVYIGKGKNDRAWNFSNSKRNEQWHQYVENNQIEVKIVVVDLLEEEALEIEKSLIKLKKPVLNVLHKN
jgi:hypothetical protein